MIITSRRARPSGLLVALTVLASLVVWAVGSAVASAAACPTLTYRSNPTLKAQRACQSTTVPTHGTQPGTYIFLTPGGAFGTGSGIYQDNGTLVWWHSDGNVNDNFSVVQFQGHSYLAVWTGRGTAWGIGSVTLYDQNYRVAGHVTTTTAYGAQGIDLHEFQITPEGNALIGSYVTHRVTYNGHSETALSYLVEKLSLVRDSSGIHTGKILFAWDSINDVPLSDSHVPDPGANGTWDYFHGNGITEDNDGNLLVSARHTWAVYKINDRPGTPGFDHVFWQVGGKHDTTAPEPWCYQHHIVALGNGQYSVYDDGGGGPGCNHPARAVVFTVSLARRPVIVQQSRQYAHNPPIYTFFTGSAQPLSNGDMLIDWANNPTVTEYDNSGQNVKMELSLSNWSYRGFRFRWVGEPTTPPSAAAQRSGSGTNVWASWNGSTEVAAWQVLAGPDASHLSPVGGRQTKTWFETQMFVPGHYATVAVRALNSSGTALETSNPVSAR
jgi:hypothetical protein